MSGPGEILLVSTYELGHQPSGIAVPKAFLERAGLRPAVLDLAVEPFDEERVRKARLVLFSVPMHTALRLALRAAERVRSMNPSAAIAFHGIYAPLHETLLREAGAVSVLGGECEEELVALARTLGRGDVAPASVTPVRRLLYPVPSRTGLPAPERYARLVDETGRERPAGHAESTRGCKHLCRHCPIPSVYGGRFFAIPVEVVVEDVAQQVALGVTHITFGDPDFLNGPRHALAVASAVHARFPELTFDFTAKVEHLVREAGLLPALRAAGALFVVSAVESLSDERAREAGEGPPPRGRRSRLRGLPRRWPHPAPLPRPVHALVDAGGLPRPARDLRRARGGWPRSTRCSSRSGSSSPRARSCSRIQRSSRKAWTPLPSPTLAPPRSANGSRSRRRSHGPSSTPPWRTGPMARPSSACGPWRWPRPADPTRTSSRRTRAGARPAHRELVLLSGAHHGAVGSVLGLRLLAQRPTVGSARPDVDAEQRVRATKRRLRLRGLLGTREGEPEVSVALRQRLDRTALVDRDHHVLDPRHGPRRVEAADPSQDPGARDGEHHHARGPRVRAGGSRAATPSRAPPPPPRA